MTQPSIWLVGSLATHARGKVLAEASGAQLPSDSCLMDSGLGLAFGTEFQDADAAEKQETVPMGEPAGRTLLLIPPFRLASRSAAGGLADLPSAADRSDRCRSSWPSCWAPKCGLK